MKQQKLFFFKLASLLTFLLFLSCNDDLYNNHEHNHGENKNKITLSQFKSETKIKDFKTIIKSNIQAMKSTNRVAELSDFVIDTLAIQRHISQNNKTTYSFRIYPLSNIALPNESFNLVYRIENNKWEQSIFSLIKKSNPLPSEEQFENKTLLFDSKTTSTTARTGEMCISEMYYVQCDGSCHGQCDGFACPTGQCIQKTIIIDFCGGSGGATGGGGDPYGGGSSDFSQSGQQPSNPYEFTPNMFDNPVYDDPNYVNAIKAQHFFSNLSFAQQVWANENVDAYNQLIQYQIDNNWSDESEMFVADIIRLADENNLEYYLNNYSENYEFENINEFENFIEYEEIDNSLSLSNPFMGDKIITHRNIKLSPLHQLTLEIVITPSPNFDLDENNSTTYFTNDLLPGNSWTQTSIIVTDESIESSPNRAEITISGYINIGIKVGDYVVGVKRKKQIIIRIDKNDGKIYFTEVRNLN